MQKLKYRLYLITVFLLFGPGSTLLHAGTALHSDDVNLYDGDKFALGVAIGAVYFDTNAKVTDKQSGTSVYLDLEGNLDLPELSRVNMFYGGYRFNQRHALLFGYFAINRQVSSVDVDKNFDDLIIVNAKLDISDKTQFYYLSYGYSLFYDDRSSVILVAGINGMDLSLLAEASGSITIGGTTKSDAKIVEANIFAPLPLIGVNFKFSITPKWSLRTKISLVGGTYQDVSASVLQTSINTGYRLSKHIALLLGMTYFNAAVTIDDEALKTDIGYGYSGVFAGMHFTF
jgi:hypothetical protein